MVGLWRRRRCRRQGSQIPTSRRRRWASTSIVRSWAPCVDTARSAPSLGAARIRSPGSSGNSSASVCPSASASPRLPSARGHPSRATVSSHIDVRSPGARGSRTRGREDRVRSAHARCRHAGEGDRARGDGAAAQRNGAYVLGGTLPCVPASLALLPCSSAHFGVCQGRAPTRGSGAVIWDASALIVLSPGRSAGTPETGRRFAFVFVLLLRNDALTPSSTSAVVKGVSRRAKC